MPDEAEQPLRVAYERRKRDIDPQLVWRGKDQQDWSDQRQRFGAPWQLTGARRALGVPRRLERAAGHRASGG